MTVFIHVLHVFVELILFLDLRNVQLVVGCIPIIESVDEDGVDSIPRPILRGWEPSLRE